MFWFIWALKSIIVRFRRTLLVIVFFSLSLGIIISIIMFLAGTDRQMTQSLRNYFGDATISARETEFDLTSMIFDIRKDLPRDISLTPVVSISGEVHSPASYIQAVFTGIPRDFIKLFAATISLPESINLSLLDTGNILLEAQLAAALDLVKGDAVTLKYQSEQGMINTIELSVAGIYIGSGLVFSNMALCNIDDLKDLLVLPDFANEVRVFTQGDTDTLRYFLKGIQEKYYKDISIESRTLDPKGGVFGIYKYYNYLVIFVFSMIVLMFLLILNFSTQNIFFANFRSRKAELSTLLTFGLARKKIRLYVFFESVILYFISLAFACLIVIAITLSTGSLTVTTYELSELITALGGPRIVYSLDMGTFIPVVLLSFIIVIYAAQKGALKYLNREIREIIHSSE